MLCFFGQKSSMKVHVIGIGGIGISALARMYLKSGARVTGSDREASSPIISELRRLGAVITRGHKASVVTRDTNLVIYTIAITENNPELIKARQLGIETKSYPEALGQLSLNRPTIAIAGTHGKTTTTAMVGEILVAARRQPMVIVGSLLRLATGRAGQHSNFIAGAGPLVVEACEYRRSFLALTPTILVITNIDNDHLDYYHDLADIEKAFAELAGKLPRAGTLVCDIGDPRLTKVIKATSAKVVDYRQLDQTARQLKLKVIGGHNRLNAAAALATAKTLGVKISVSSGALEKFRGTWRRLEYIGRTRRGALIYDDYGHHPTEIRATLAAIRRELVPKRLIVIFQPHLYSRTKILFKDFTTSFSAADEIMILPIYAARESKDKTVSSRILAEATPRATYVPNLAAAEKRLTTTHRGDLILTLGAGPVFVLAERLRYNR